MRRSNKVYEAILFDGAQHHSIASLLPDNTIIVSGVSKSYAWTGGRIGWAIFPTADEAAIFRNLNINYFSCVPAYNQFGAQRGLDRDDERGLRETPRHGLDAPEPDRWHPLQPPARRVQIVKFVETNACR